MAYMVLFIQQSPLLQKTTGKTRPRGNKPILFPWNAVHKGHQVHTPCGMLMWKPCCAQQLGRNHVLYRFICDSLSQKAGTSTRFL